MEPTVITRHGTIRGRVRDGVATTTEARAAGPTTTYDYEFAWPSPVNGLGACHSLEISFVFDNLSAEGAELALGQAPPAELADRMHAARIAFARDGDPGSRSFDDTYPVMIFDSAGGGLQADPRGDERSIWAHSRIWAHSG
jgi:para-nitrobenzyl esterase